MVVLVILGVLVSVYLARRMFRPKTIITEFAVKQYRPDRAQFPRTPGRRSGHRRRAGL
jgi:hypothetical protein